MRRINGGSKSTSSLPLGSKSTPTKLDSIGKTSKKHDVSISPKNNYSLEAFIPSTLDEDAESNIDQHATSFSITDLLQQQKQDNSKESSSPILGREGGERGYVQNLSSTKKNDKIQPLLSSEKLTTGGELPLVHDPYARFSPQKKRQPTEDLKQDQDAYVDHLAPAENTDLFAYESALYHRVTGQYIPKQVLEKDPTAQAKEIERIRQVPELYQAVQSITKLSKQFHLLAQDCLGHRKELGHAMISMEEKYLKLFEKILSVSLKLYWHHAQIHAEKLQVEQKLSLQWRHAFHAKELECGALKKVLASKESLLKAKQIDIQDLEQQIKDLTQQIQQQDLLQQEIDELNKQRETGQALISQKEQDFKLYQRQMEDKVEFEKTRLFTYQEEQRKKDKEIREKIKEKDLAFTKQLILLDQMTKQIQEQEKVLQKTSESSTQTIVHEEDGFWEQKDCIPKYVSKHLVHRLMWKRFDAFVKCKNCHGKAIPKQFFMTKQQPSQQQQLPSHQSQAQQIQQQKQEGQDNSTNSIPIPPPPTSTFSTTTSSIYREEDQDYIDFWSLEKRTIEKSIQKANTRPKSISKDKEKKKSTSTTITTSLLTSILIPKHLIKQQKEWFLPLPIRLFLSNLPRTVLAFPLFALDQVIFQIEEIYQDKFQSDQVDTQDGVATEDMVHFITEFFLKQYSVRQAAEIALYRFLVSIKVHYPNNSHVKLFARFLSLLKARKIESNGNDDEEEEEDEEKKQERGKEGGESGKNKTKKELISTKKQRITPLDRSHLRVFLHARHYLLSRPSSRHTNNSHGSSGHEDPPHVIQVDPYKKWVPLEHTVHIIRWYLSFLPEQNIIDYCRQIEYSTASYAGKTLTEVTGNRLAVRAEMRKAMLPNDPVSKSSSSSSSNDAGRPGGTPRILVDAHKALLLLMNAMEHRREVMRQELLDMFAKGDTNHDAVLSLEEFSQIIRLRVPNFSDRRILRMFREALMGGKDQSFALSMDSFVHVCLDHGLVSLLPEELFGDPFQPKKVLASNATTTTTSSSNKSHGSITSSVGNSTTAQGAAAEKKQAQQQLQHSSSNGPSRLSVQYKGHSPSFQDVTHALEAFAIRNSSGSSFLLETSIILPKTRGKDIGSIGEDEEDGIPEENGLVSYHDHGIDDEDDDVDEVEEEYGGWL